MLIKKISYEDLADLKYFFDYNCGSSSESFTYFKKRTYEVIKNHIVTLLLYENNQPIGYSHLDKDGDNIWFGICVGEHYKGKGLGRQLMLATLKEADKQKISPILLTVYRDNIQAIKLYENLGFKVYKQNDMIFFMKKE